jgi:5-methylcytosine-specific restriction endonuclease McrA
MTTEIITRLEAKARKLAFYFTGKPCKHGHTAIRKTVNGTCMVCHAETLERYRTENPDHIRETDRLHRLANVEKHRENNRQYRLNNLESVRERDRLRYANGDRELHRKHRRDRKARQRNAPGSHTIEQLRELLEKQNFTCIYCPASLKEERQLDHIQALARGGSNDISNLQWLCPTCNGRKHAKDPIEFARELGKLL